MASPLKRVVDYKLLYDSLADPSNGMINVTTLTARWPKDQLAIARLPRDLPEHWRRAADDNGYLDWERFSSGLKEALDEDRHRLSQTAAEGLKQMASTLSSANHSQQRSSSAAVAPRVTPEEIEAFLSKCRREILAQALSRTRKEVYKCQMSLHQLESPSTCANASISGRAAKQQDHSSNAKGHVQVPLVSTVGQEKEELLKGMEVMEITRLWFNSRLEQLTLEEKQPAKKLKPEQLLAALERRGDQPESETLKHIQEINSHLSQLAKEAPGFSFEQVKKQYYQQQQLLQQQKKAAIKTVASDPGPFSHGSNKPLVSSQGGGGGERAQTTRATPKVQMNFPAYSPASRTHAGPSSRTSPPVRSNSMREMHHIRGEAEVAATGQRPAQRTVSMSTQNLTDQIQHQYHHQQQPHGSSSMRPRRSNSFSTSSGDRHPATSGGGGYSSGNIAASSGGSSTSDYPRTASSSRGYGTLNQYPLRGSSSLQTLPSSGSYGNNSSSSNTTVPSGHAQKHGSHHSHHGYQGQRSSSVRNIPSAYGGITMATTTATPSGPGHMGRPIIAQPTSTTARVESVDIPNQSSATAAMQDLSSSYPGHSRGPRTGSGHTHGGTRGENPKSSRRQLHKAVQEQSLRIKQLEAENVVLTRDRGYRGQKQSAAAASNNTGQPVIRKSALQSVV